MTTLNLQEVSNLSSLVSSQAIVTPLGDPYTIGISGMIFDIVGRVSVKASAEITDHFVEANYAVQDHMALKPLMVTMEGKAAELVNVYQPSLLQRIYTTLTGLIPLAGYAPTFNVQDSQFYAQMNKIAQLGQNIVNTASTAFQIFSAVATLVTKQQSVFQFLLNMRNSRQLCTVETPFAIFENMLIEDLDCEQNEETTKISEFSLRFKQILTVNSVQGTAIVSSTDTQNAGSTSIIPPAASVGLQSYVVNPVSLGSGFGSSTNANGANLDVNNTLLSVYQQQSSL